MTDRTNGSTPPDNEPDYRLQFHLLCGDADPAHRAVTATAEGLRKMKYPVVLTTIENGEHKGKAGDGQFLKRGTCVNI